MLWVEDNLQQSLVPVCPTTILRGARALSLKAANLFGRPFTDFFHPYFVFPSISHVVGVDEARTFARSNVLQHHTLCVDHCLRKVGPFGHTFAVLLTSYVEEI